MSTPSTKKKAAPSTPAPGAVPTPPPSVVGAVPPLAPAAEEEEEEVKPTPTSVFQLVAVNVGNVPELIANETAIVAASSESLSVEQLASKMPESLQEMGTKGRGLIIGVSAVRVAKEFSIMMIGARRSGNPTPLVYAGVLSVAVAYTVSSQWVAEYGNLPGPHMFTPFEITGRTEIAAGNGRKAVTWVTGTGMNAAALRIFGSMIVEAGGNSAFLKQLKADAGTIFHPIEGATERDTLMKEANKSISKADRDVLAIFKDKFSRYAEVVGAMFGGSSGDVLTYLDAADKLGEVYI